jgi:hypothetical protein
MSDWNSGGDKSVYNIMCYDDGIFPIFQYIRVYIAVLNAKFIFLLIYVSSYLLHVSAVYGHHQVSVSPANIVSLSAALSHFVFDVSFELNLICFS